LTHEAEAGTTHDLYHLAAGGATSWCGFAREILKISGIDTLVRAISTSEYPTSAKRPANSVLSGAAISARWKLQLPQWQNSLAACLCEASSTASTRS
jgi:dTDP-4-dehydrorhamnose reductase